MPYIEIVEKDETTPGALAEQTDVVYIPGFVDISQKCLNDNNGYIGIEANVPTLFTSVKQFESLCGKRPAIFSNDQKYTDLIEVLPNGQITGFDADAVPYHKVMFSAGTEDPSYIMAKEYLSAGLNVIYERVNQDYYLEKVTAQPVDWNSNFKNYLINVPQQYKKLDDATSLPLWYEEVKFEDVKPTGTYYKAVLDVESNIITKFIKVDNNETLTNKDVIVIKTKDFYKLQGDDYVVVTGNDREMPSISDSNLNWGVEYKNHYELIKNVIMEIDAEKAPEFDAENTYRKSDGINIKTMYSALEGLYDTDMNGLADKGNYSIKYLTSGGYPVYEYSQNSVVNKMINLAATRGDCVAFIDHTDRPDREDNIDLKGSVYNKVKSDTAFATKGEFATMFTPWASYNRTTTDKDDEGKNIKSGSVRMPASYAYFNALADSIKTNANWLAIAGSARGIVPNLATKGMTTNIPNGAADAMQPRDDVAVNAITNIKPYGWTIWGNRTLKNNAEAGNLTATSFLNTRNLISDIKKTAYSVARKLTFEQNNDILWVNFKGLISPTLDRMLRGYGISGYKIVRDTEHEKASEKATVCAKIILYPVYAVEDFYITIVLKDDEVNVE